MKMLLDWLVGRREPDPQRDRETRLRVERLNDEVRSMRRR